jgi:hypothetical protein
MRRAAIRLQAHTVTRADSMLSYAGRSEFPASPHQSSVIKQMGFAALYPSYFKLLQAQLPEFKDVTDH